MKKVISTTKAPKAIGPYSQAILASNTLYVSGQLPIDYKTGLISDDIRVQTQKSLENLLNIVHDAGFELTDIVKCTVYLKDLNHFEQMNDVYANFFYEHKPARVAVEVARLPRDVLVEIDAIAVK